MPISRIDILREAKGRGLLDSETTLEMEALEEAEKRGLIDPTEEGDGFFSGVKEDIVKNLPEIIGGTALPTAAAIATGGISLPASVALGGLGAAGGRAFKQIGKRILGREDVPQTPGEAAKDIAKEGAVGALAELGGRAMIGTARKVLGPFKGRVEPIARKIKDSFLNVGGRLTPAQATNTAILDVTENMAEGSFTGGGRIRAFKLAQQGAVKEMEEQLSDQFAVEATEKLSDEAIGELFLNTARKGRAVHSSVATGLYKNVDELTKGVNVDFVPVVNQIDELGKRLRIEQTPELTRLLGTVRSDIAERGLDKLNFTEAHALRSSLLSKARDLSEVPGEGASVKALNSIALGIDDAMSQAAKRLPDKKAFNAWRSANKFFKEGKETFDNDFMAKLIIGNKKTPERIGETILRKGNVTEVRQALKAVKRASQLDPTINFDETWKTMQAGFYEDMITRATNADTGEISGKRILSFLNDRKTRRTMDIAFSKKQIDAITEFAETAAITQRRTPGSGGMVMQLAQGGAAIGFVGGILGDKPILRDSSMGLFVAPWVAARLFTSPAAIKWLTSGFKIGKIGEASARIISQLSSQATKEAVDAERLND